MFQQLTGRDFGLIGAGLLRAELGSAAMSVLSGLAKNGADLSGLKSLLSAFGKDVNDAQLLGYAASFAGAVWISPPPI
jgi:hypothetical protein